MPQSLSCRCHHHSTRPTLPRCINRHRQLLSTKADRSSRTTPHARSAASRPIATLMTVVQSIVQEKLTETTIHNTHTEFLPPETQKNREMMGSSAGRRLLLSDFIISFMWVWSSVLIKMFVYNILGFGHHDLQAEIFKHAIAVVNMFAFAYLAKLTKGGAYNPLTILSSAISGNFSQFLFIAGARIPAQVFGSIFGVWLIREVFPAIGTGPKLSVDIHRGALTEGILTFTIVIVSLGLSRKIPGSFFMKTWISSLSKLTLHILGSDLTGGCMNPASVMGWAYARGDHITKEHVFVYWLAPIEATLLAVWMFNLLVQPQEKEKALKKNE